MKATSHSISYIEVGSLNYLLLCFVWRCPHSFQICLGETLPLKRPSSETLKGFSEYLESLLGVDVSTQKIFLMNKCLTSSEAFKELTLEQLVHKDHKFRLFHFAIFFDFY